MNLKNNLVFRFLSDTPSFFKWLDLVGLIMVAVAGLLANNNCSGQLITVTGAIGTTICLLSKFVKKDVQLLQESTDDFNTIKENLPEFKQQAEAIIRTLKPVLNNGANQKP